MAIGDDFAIDYTNKRIYHNTGDTVYTVNALYSWLQDTFDELNQMDDEVPMSAQTPTAYTMINGWWLDISEDSYAHKYLSGGAIETSGYANWVIQKLEVDSQSTQAQSSDVGKDVKDDGTTVGPLLGFITKSGTTQTWWVRDERETPAQIADSSAMTITGSSADGTADGASASGEELFANVYTLGTIESSPSPQIYIFQNGSAISEWSDLTNWERGHIDVLIQVKEAGTEIDNAVITVFARQYGDLYDNFEIDLTDGGRNAVPLSTATDLDNDSPEKYLLFDSTDLTFSAGEIVQELNGTWSAEVVSVQDNGSTGYVGIGGLKGTISDNDTFWGHTSSAYGSTNGTDGSILVSYDTETVEPTTLGQVMVGSASGAKGILRGVSNLSNDGLLLMDTNGDYQADSSYYTAFQSSEIVNGSTEGKVTLDGVTNLRAVAGYDDIGIWFMNGHIGVDSNNTLDVGMNVTGQNSGATGVVLYDPGVSGGSVFLGNVTGTWESGETMLNDDGSEYATTNSALTLDHTVQKNFSQQSAYDYDVVVECRGRTLAQVYEYFKYVTREDSTFSMYSLKLSGASLTFNTLDGEEYIRAYIDEDTPANSYTPKKASPLGTFAGGVLFGAQGVWLQNMASADSQNFQLIDSNGNTRTPPVSVTVKISSIQAGDRVSVFRTSSGSIDKAMYALTDDNSGAGTTLWIATALDSDTPDSGYVRIVDTSAETEERIFYDSWSGSAINLSTAHSGGYGSTDTIYIPFIDTTATGTSAEETVIYSSNRAVLIRVRLKGILPFETSGTINTSGLSVAAIRTADSIVS